jgi:hypothetical protein
MAKQPVVRQDSAAETVEEKVKMVTPETIKQDQAIVAQKNVVSDEEMFAEAEKDRGFETDELVVPFLKILQPLTPICLESSNDYNPAAKPGMFYNTSTEQLHDGKVGIVVVPITHQKSFTEWTPLASGGGFIKDWQESLAWKSLLAEGQEDAYRPMTKDGHEIRRALLHFVYVVDATTGYYTPAVFSFAGTQIKRARRWSSMMANAMIPTANGPRPAAHSFYSYKVTTDMEKNQKGTWYLPRIVPNVAAGENSKWISIRELINGRQIWDAAKAFRESLLAGTIHAAPMYDDEMERGGGSGREGDEVAF